MVQGQFLGNALLNVPKVDVARRPIQLSPNLRIESVLLNHEGSLFEVMLMAVNDNSSVLNNHLFHIIKIFLRLVLERSLVDSKSFVAKNIGLDNNFASLLLDIAGN